MKMTNMRKCFLWGFAAWVTGGALLCCGGETADKATLIRCGAKLVKAELGIEQMPRVAITDEIGRWNIMKGEAWTGVNPHEFYFTLEAMAKDAAPPKVEIV